MKAAPHTLEQVPVIVDDASLVERAIHGDEDAFRAIFERHVAAVRRFAIARIEATHVDDVVMEAFAEFWRTIDRFDATQPVRPWLLGIASVRARRRATSEWRQADVRDRHASIVERPVAEAPDEAIIDQQVVAALLRLRDAEREVLVLVAIGELSVSEAARTIGISATAARVRLHRARRAMRVELERRDQA